MRTLEVTAVDTTERRTVEVIEHALHAAVRAPSPHNSQPWRFLVRPDHVDLWLDRDRVLAAADPSGREARIACGAALYNLVLDLAAAGHATSVDLVPDRSASDLLARVWLVGRRRRRTEEVTLASVIHHRTSNRRPFLDRPVSTVERTAMSRAAGVEGGFLKWLDGPGETSRFTGLLRRAEAAQAADPSFRAELRRWVSRPVERGDGVPWEAAPMRPTQDDVLALRDFHGDAAVERPFEHDPQIAILTSYGDTAVDHLRAGQALQHVLLVATLSGVSTSFITQPLEHPDSRDAVRELVGRHLHPQVALRVGYGHPTPTTRRRAVADVSAPPPAVIP